MTIRGLSSWQTALADLSLILFAVVAASYREESEEAEPASPDQAVEIALGQPMAVFRPVGDADLARWLTLQDMGEGEVATVVVRHLPGEATGATREAAELVQQIEAGGHQARLMVEPSSFPETLVVIAHDRHSEREAVAGT
ncbi:MAG: hypothetical protein CL953_06335 [Erythrobacteraceae bacterium]|nr:hypothetical protein [Erythrobacteraceae bacterium]